MLMAAQAGHTEIAQTLLDAGAEFDVAMDVRALRPPALTALAVRRQGSLDLP